MDRLNGQVAIITGGSRGIGCAVALAFAREGARVAITAVHDPLALEETKKQIESLGYEVMAVIADVSRRADIDGLVQAIVRRWSRIDILVNNAGVLNPVPLEKLGEKQWDETLSVHLKGTFNCTQAVIPIMKRNGRGKIINIAAPSALRGSFGVSDYAAAKGGIIAFSRNAANELKAYNIQVNCISPVADTRMTESLTKFRHDQLGQTQPHREFIAPETIAPAFIFFASSDSDSVSGQLLEVGKI
ncbi:MAG: SDR family oxidoreductase [Deltaproteobacteria bacterium]|nr:SDR family oxidoreductase [Deltaproteobacteria bacterium]